MSRTVESEYTLIQELGRGAFSVVRMYRHNTTDEIWAVKSIQKNEVPREILENEIIILKRVRHPNVIQLKEVFETQTELNLVMEFIGGGELFDEIISRVFYKEEDASFIMKQILDATSYLHRVGVAHRDLKPENLLLVEKGKNIIKVSDFGLAAICGEDVLMKQCCGSPGYVAPEVLVGKGYDKKCDLWSAGVILYILLCGYPPFAGPKFSIVKKKILAGKYSFPEKEWSRVSPEAIDLVQKLLTLDSNQRLSADEALQHPWIANINISQGGQLGENVIDNMKQWNAKRKLKGIMIAALAVKALTHYRDHQEEAERIEGEGLADEDEGPIDVNANPVLANVIGHFTHNKKEQEQQQTTTPTPGATSTTGTSENTTPPIVAVPEKPIEVVQEKPKQEPEKQMEKPNETKLSTATDGTRKESGPTGSMQEIDISTKDDKKKKSTFKKFLCC